MLDILLPPIVCIFRRFLSTTANLQINHSICKFLVHSCQCTTVFNCITNCYVNTCNGSVCGATTGISIFHSFQNYNTVSSFYCLTYACFDFLRFYLLQMLQLLQNQRMPELLLLQVLLLVLPLVLLFGADAATAFPAPSSTVTS